MAATSHSSDDERWSDWEEDEGSEMPTQGLFAPARVFSTPAECLRAARTEHGFDLLAVANGLGMYERIQLVNFIRARTAEGEEAAALVPLITSAIASSDARPWKEERYLRSVVEGDPLLFSMGGLDGDDETDEDEDEARKGRAQEDDEMIRQALIAEPSALNGLAGGSADGVEPGAEALASQMAQMRQLLQEMAADPVEVRGTTSADTDDDEVQGEGGGAGPSSAALNQATAGGSGGSGSGGAGQVGPGRRRRGNKPRTMAEKVDEGYFGSYGELGIHHTMLSDRVRTEAYRDAIKQPWMAGKTVLDIGCGTAILSLFAASAGAEHVYGVDASGIITHALEIVRCVPAGCACRVAPNGSPGTVHRSLAVSPLRSTRNTLPMAPSPFPPSLAFPRLASACVQTQRDGRPRDAAARQGGGDRAAGGQGGRDHLGVDGLLPAV